ncbi:MAG: acyltransferase [Clostridia bacterium]|nr:acyltransferase [Clostridia bacterium]
MDKVAREKTRFRTFQQKDYLDLQISGALKGWLAVCVLASHAIPAAGIFAGSIINPLVASLGYLSVSVFFFLSGFGIMAQWERRKEAYLDCFLRTRVLSHYLLNVFLIVIYSLFAIFVGKNFSLIEFLQSFAIGSTIVSNGWYMQVLLLFYLLWYVCAKTLAPSKQAFLITVSVLVLGYMIVGFCFMTSTWWESSLSFLLGIFWQRNKEKIDNIIFKSKKQWIVLLCLSVISFSGFFLLANINLLSGNAFLNTIVRMTAKSISSPIFVALVLFVCMSLPIKWFLSWPISRFLGNVSLEIYVLQGIPLAILRNHVSVENGWIYIMFVVLGTALLVVFLRPIIRFIIFIPKKVLLLSKAT